MILKPADDTDIKKVESLYMSAFPKDERAPFNILLKGNGQILVADEDDKFIGFTYVVSQDDLAYLFYLAIDQDQRIKGNGTKLLQLLKNDYDRIFIARERLEKDADNYDIRIKRHEFYLKNDFKDLDMWLIEGPVIYDVMSYGGSVRPEEYADLIQKWSKNIKLPAKMYMIPKN